MFCKRVVLPFAGVAAERMRAGEQKSVVRRCYFPCHPITTQLEFLLKRVVFFFRVSGMHMSEFVLLRVVFYRF